MYALEVRSTFDATGLPDGLECYTMVSRGMVVVQSGSQIAIVICQQPEGQLLCDCLHHHIYGTCDHVKALLNGLWGRLASLPQGWSLVVRTKDWCNKPYLLPIGQATLTPLYAHVA